MSLKSFFQSLKNVFWFGSVSEDLKKRSLSEAGEERDIFFISRNVQGCEEELAELTDWFDEFFEDPIVEVDDPGETEPYMLKHLKIETESGTFQLIYYENYELVLRGDRELVLEIQEPIAERLGVMFQRI